MHFNYTCRGGILGRRTKREKQERLEVRIGFTLGERNLENFSKRKRKLKCIGVGSRKSKVEHKTGKDKEKEKDVD